MSIKSVFGGGDNPQWQNIYGGNVSTCTVALAKAKANGNSNNPSPATDCMTMDLFLKFLDIVDVVDIIVEKLFPTIEVKGAYIGQMSGSFYLSPAMASRLLWRKEYPDDKWEASEEQIIQLLDIYLQNGWDWKGDKLLQNNSAIITPLLSVADPDPVPVPVPTPFPA